VLKLLLPVNPHVTKPLSAISTRPSTTCRGLPLPKRCISQDVKLRSEDAKRNHILVVFGHLYKSLLQGRRHGFKPGWVNILGKIRRKTPKKIFALPTLVFSLPTLDLITRVGKDPPAIIEGVIIAYPLALRTIHFAYQFVYIQSFPTIQH